MLLWSMIFQVYVMQTYTFIHFLSQSHRTAKIVSLGEEAHLNTSFKHFIFFVQEFQLIEKKELAPLQELITSLTEEKGGAGRS